MKSKKYDIGEVFQNIERAAGAMDDVAKTMLLAIRSEGASTLEAFDDMVRRGYESNGWSQKLGRPTAGMESKPAPHAVKLYVSNVRAAYRAGLNVIEFQTMGALRKSLSDARSQPAQGGQKERRPELRGVQLSANNSLTGALWHDVMVVWDHLPKTKQAELERQVRELLAKFQKAAQPQLKLVA